MIHKQRVIVGRLRVSPYSLLWALKIDLEEEITDLAIESSVLFWGRGSDGLEHMMDVIPIVAK